MAEFAATLSGLVKRFGTVTALAGIDANIPFGRLTGLAGPDGAGKTTLMRLLAGLMTPTTGSLSVTSDIGYMPQRFGLYEDLTVRENLILYAELRQVPAADQPGTFARLLDFTRLDQFTDRLAGALSGGMKQKLGLACALMGKPRLLLLDEPGVGVDPVSRQDLWRMVQELTDGGMAVLWSTAYLDEAERCPSVLLLHEGRLLHDGPPAQMIAPLVGRSVHLLAPVRDRRQLLADALAQPNIRDGVIQGEAVRLVLTATTAVPGLAAWAARRGGQVRPVAPCFEDAFIDRLGGSGDGRSLLADHMPALTHAANAEPMIACRDLTRRFGAFTAADQVRFAVAPGELFGLLGPNGAGKSTTFKMLCGLLKPTSGQALVAGYDLRRDAGRAKSRLGYMAQKFSLYGLLSVRQNLEFSAGIYGLVGALRRQRIDEMIETFQLQPYLNAAPGDLSLGYRQRLALACALMHQPAVLFLDEPTSGVDPLTRREFWTHINGLVRKGVTVLVTTHFMDEAEYCDRVALMYRSRLIALDSPDQLKRQVQAAGADLPTMEQAFIRLIERFDAEGAA